jgi:hypothetical protein
MYVAARCAAALSGAPIILTLRIENENNQYFLLSILACLGMGLIAS